MFSGIIIDNFSALRENQEQLEEDKKNVCFICGLNRNFLNKLYGNEEGYSEHIKLDHYYWNYLFLIINLLKKKNLSGIDFYIFNNFKSETHIWIPFKNCIQSIENEKDK